jgi:hypothetical protein
MPSRQPAGRRRFVLRHIDRRGGRYSIAKNDPSRRKIRDEGDLC